MASYTIEDIELIRRKSGISYQEAVALLDYHNGNVARALVDLERNGRLDPKANQKQQQAEKRAASSAGKSSGSAKNLLLELLTKAYRARIKIRKEDTLILNVSVLFALLSILISPHLVIIGAIVCLVLGYRFGFEKNDKAFAGENLEKMVRSAADNVKASVSDFTKGFQNTGEPKAESAEEAPRSYYAAHAEQPVPPRPTYRASAPTLNVPVQVESQDGKITLENDDEGYSSATVE